MLLLVLLAKKQSSKEMAEEPKEWRHPERRWLTYTWCKSNVNETNTTYDTKDGHAQTNVIQIGECWVYNFDNLSQRVNEVILGNSPDVRLVSEPKE